ncbi:MAG: carboxymuconolactone decarboxylase family protein [Woeseiaceae bacterium]|nr:carboxymuconolactone decarboxylase family protein [Woeseiaceae bacterium]
MEFQVHSENTAPSASQETLARIVERYGFIPNLAGVFAESPGAFNGLLGAMTAYDAPDITLSMLERQVVLLAVSAKNRCEYCTAAHSMLASMNGLDRAGVNSLQQGRPLGDKKLEALRTFAEKLVEKRGWVPKAEVDEFIATGFTKAQVLEVVFGVALKTLTNYANHIANPPVNEQFAAFLPKWSNAA